MLWIHTVIYAIMVLGYYFKPLLENGLFMVWINTMKFWMKFGINSWCDGMNLFKEIYVLNSYMKYMYESIMRTKWTKDGEGEQEVCPYLRKVEQVLQELIADECLAGTYVFHILNSYYRFISLMHILNSYYRFI